MCSGWQGRARGSASGTARCGGRCRSPGGAPAAAALVADSNHVSGRVGRRLRKSSAAAPVARLPLWPSRHDRRRPRARAHAAIFEGHSPGFASRLAELSSADAAWARIDAPRACAAEPRRARPSAAVPPAGASALTHFPRTLTSILEPAATLAAPRGTDRTLVSNRHTTPSWTSAGLTVDTLAKPYEEISDPYNFIMTFSLDYHVAWLFSREHLASNVNGI